MEYKSSSLDLHAQELLREVFAEVHREIAGHFDEASIPQARVDRSIASALMSAVATGSRDPAFLKRYALHVVAVVIRRANHRSKQS